MHTYNVPSRQASRDCASLRDIYVTESPSQATSITIVIIYTSTVVIMTMDIIKHITYILLLLLLLVVLVLLLS